MSIERVAEWNSLCGKDVKKFGTKAYYDALMSQSLRIQEELDELNLAIQIASELADSIRTQNRKALWFDGMKVKVLSRNLEYWNTEILDAGCDLSVTVDGLNYLSGHDTVGAIEAVLDNNDVKYTKDLAHAEDSLHELGYDTHLLVEVYKPSTKELIFSVHRIEDDKICKLIDHPKVNLGPFTRKC